MRTEMKTLLMSAVAAGVLAGCGGTKTIEVQGNKAPAWVKDPDIAAEKFPEAVCGTGMSQRFNDPGLTRDVADQHAFTKIAEEIGAQVTTDTQRTTETGRSRGNVTKERSTVEQTRRTRADMTIDGLEVRERFTNEAGQWYSLACLNKAQINQDTRDLLEERLAQKMRAGGQSDSDDGSGNSPSKKQE